MAIYHCSVKIISKSGGKSVVASAAYRSGEKLNDNEVNQNYKYQKPEVVDTKITLPDHAPKDFLNREALWNSVQQTEKQTNAQLAREFVLAIPHELPLEQAKDLIHKFSKSLADEGICVDSAIHWKGGNHHAHLLTTTRPLNKNGTWGSKEKKAYLLDANGNKVPELDENGNQKTRIRKGKGVEKLWKRTTIEANDWNKKEKLLEWRKRWQDFTNEQLQAAGVNQTIDCRSYEERGLPLIPTIHEGYEAREIEKRGGVSDRCEHNRRVKKINKDFLMEYDEIKKAKERIEKGLHTAPESPLGSVTLCRWNHLQPQERRAIASALPELFEKNHLKNKDRQKQQKDFISNAVFARSENGRLYMTELNKTKAINMGLLAGTGNPQTIKPSQINTAAKSAGKELINAAKDRGSGAKGGKSVIDGIKGGLSSFGSSLQQKAAGEHAKEAIGNVKEVLKTPVRVVQDILSNPLTGILKIPFRATEATLRGVSVVGNVTGIALSGDREEARTRHR